MAKSSLYLGVCRYRYGFMCLIWSHMFTCVCVCQLKTKPLIWNDISLYLQYGTICVSQKESITVESCGNVLFWNAQLHSSSSNTRSLLSGTDSELVTSKIVKKWGQVSLKLQAAHCLKNSKLHNLYNVYISFLFMVRFLSK